MPNSDLVRLRHILDAAREAVAFCQSRTRQDLDTDRMFYHCLVRLLEVVGEAARAVSREFREAHPEVAWRRMVGMRDGCRTGTLTSTATSSGGQPLRTSRRSSTR